METTRWMERFRIGTGLSLGLAVFVGLCEHSWLALTQTQPLRWAESFVLGVCLIATLCVWSTVGSLLMLQAHRKIGQMSFAVVIRRHLMVTSAALFVWYVVPFMLSMMALETYAPVVVVLLLSSVVGLLFLMNVRYWVRRMSERGPPSARAWGLALGSALFLLSISSTVWSQRGPGRGFALEGDRSVLLITLDGLERAGVRPETQETRWASFSQAVTPSPTVRSTHASSFTGLHPLRHGVFGTDPDAMQEMPVLADALAAEGYLTAGFVSSTHLLRDSGVGRGFQTYDDDVATWMPGLRLTSIQPWMERYRVPLNTTGEVQRRAPEHAQESATRWMDSAGESPWFIWTHLDARGADRERTLASAEALTESALTVTDGELLVVWLGTSGAAETNTKRPLQESALRLPLFVHASWLDDVTPDVRAQVRPMDVYATVLDAVGVRAPGPMEGVSLLPYIRGEDSASLWCSLVAQDDEDGYWLGLRNDRVKYVEDVTGAHRLYDLQVDPEATTDVSSDQESVVLRAQDILAPERKALARWQERS